jgi:hypothetical protein
LSPLQWYIVRSELFIKWFGNWLYTGKYDSLILQPRIKIEKRTTSDLKSFKTHHDRNRFLKDLCRSEKTEAQTTIGKVIITSNGIEHSLNHCADGIVLESVYFLKELFETGINFGKEPYHVKGPNDKNVDFLHFEYIFNVASFNGKEYIFRASVPYSKAQKGYVLRDYNFEEIKKPDGFEAVRDQESNLTPNPFGQYKDTKISDLYNTFSANVSKVVDPNGEPLICYHGSNKHFSIFNTKQRKHTWRYPFIFVAHDKELAKRFASFKLEDESMADKLIIYPLFVNMKAPFDLFNNKKQLALAEKINNKTIDTTKETWFFLETAEMAKAIKLGGFDGIYTTERVYGGTPGSDELEKNIGVYDSNQLKLADGVNTTFDGANPDIRYKDGGEIKVYTEAEIRARWKKKKNNIAQLSENIQSLRNNVTRMLKSENEKERLVALIIAIMLKTAERVGNNESAENKHFGVSMFRKKHLDIKGNTVELTYLGKTGVQQDKSFTDEAIVEALKQAIKNTPNQFIFTTTKGLKIGENQVNKFLSDEYGITSKVIRGFLANKYIADRLSQQKPAETEPERKKQFSEAVKWAAARVGHTPATLKKHYMLPKTEERYLKGGEIRKP